MRRHAVLIAVVAAIVVPVAAAFATVSMSASPSSLSFPTQCTHSTSDAQTVTVTNNGDTPATDVAVSVYPTPMASVFGLGGQTGAAELAPGGSLQVQVGFTPQHVGNSSATAIVTFTDPGSSQGGGGGGGPGQAPPRPSPSPTPTSTPTTGSIQIPLSGSAIDRFIDANPPGVNFGSVHNGKPGPKKTLTIYDDGFSPLHISGMFLGGRSPNDFTVGQLSSDVVTDGHPATVELAFNPKQPGARAAQLVIHSDSCSGSLTVQLAGISTEQDITASPKEVDFGNPLQGAAPTQLVSVINQGNFPLTVKSIGLVKAGALPLQATSPASPKTTATPAPSSSTPAASPGATDVTFFSLTGMPKKFPLKLQPGQAIQLTVHFNTAQLGLKQAALKVVSDDPDHATFGVPITANTVPRPTPTPTQSAAPPPVKPSGPGFHLHLGAYLPTVAAVVAVAAFFWLLVMVRRRRGIPE